MDCQVSAVLISHMNCLYELFRICFVDCSVVSVDLFVYILYRRVLSTSFNLLIGQTLVAGPRQHEQLRGRVALRVPIRP